MAKQLQSKIGARGLICLTIIILSANMAYGQRRTLPEEDWYGDIKQGLRAFYLGKGVRVTMPVPKGGLEILDGVVQRPSDARAPEYIAQPGDELKVKSLEFTDHEIEFTLGGDEPPPKRRFPNPFVFNRPPRVKIFFSREINAQDLTIENINRFLGLAVDVAALKPPAEKVAPAEEAEPEPASVPGLKIIGTLTDSSICELTVESTPPAARIYIDGSFSGNSPRTFRLSPGEHIILIIHDGYNSWERKLSLPEGKTAALIAELSRK